MSIEPKKGTRIEDPRSKNAIGRFNDIAQKFEQEQKKVNDVYVEINETTTPKEINETTTHRQNMEGLLQYQKESIFNKCFKIKYPINQKIFDVLMDIDINPTTARFRGVKYTQGSDFQIMMVIHFKGPEPIGYILLLSDWLEKITDDQCPEIPPSFLGFDVVFPDLKIAPKKIEESKVSDSDDDSDDDSDLDDDTEAKADSYEEDVEDFDLNPKPKPKNEQEEIYDQEHNIKITFEPLTAFRPGREDDCFILFSIGNNILGIQYFICPVGGKELLRDTIQVLNKNQSKVGSFENIELTAADLDPNKFNPKFYS
jgi:hypothetical protein